MDMRRFLKLQSMSWMSMVLLLKPQHLLMLENLSTLLVDDNIDSLSDQEGVKMDAKSVKKHLEGNDFAI